MSYTEVISNAAMMPGKFFDLPNAWDEARDINPETMVLPESTEERIKEQVCEAIETIYDQLEEGFIDAYHPLLASDDPQDLVHGRILAYLHSQVYRAFHLLAQGHGLERCSEVPNKSVAFPFRNAY